MIKVCIISSVHPPFDVRIFHKEAETLVKAGYEVLLIAQHDKAELVDGVRIINLKTPGNRMARMTKTVWSAFRKALKTNAALYHIHDPELMPIGFLLKFLGKEVIYDMHENLPKQIRNKEWINPKLRYLVSKIVCFAERAFLHNIPIIFAEISYHKDYLWVKNYETILNLPVLSHLAYVDNGAIEKNKFAIGYIGAVSNARGSMETLEALKILSMRGFLPSFECVGPMTASHEEELLNKCREYQLTNVKLYGYLPADKGWPVIQRCSVGLALLHPISNYYESYPTKIFEYMAMGIPVIASNFPLYRSIIEAHNCGICVDPLDPHAIADALCRLMDNPSEAKALGANGRAAVEEIYNWDVESAKLLDFYTKLLAQSSN